MYQKKKIALEKQQKLLYMLYFNRYSHEYLPCEM
jgi:hypothetical protein